MSVIFPDLQAKKWCYFGEGISRYKTFKASLLGGVKIPKL